MDKAKENINQKKNHGLIIKIGLPILGVCLVLGMFQLVNSVPAVKEAITLATTMKPETFTELYFEDHNNLPKTFEKAKKYTFRFTIHNLEYQDMNYSYEVNAIDEEEKSLIASGSARLKQAEAKTIEESFSSDKNYKRVKIEVRLIEKNQQIDFWMEKQ